MIPLCAKRTPVPLEVHQSTLRTSPRRQLAMSKGENGSQLSAYERQRLQRIKENEDFLRSLDLSQVATLPISDQGFADTSHTASFIREQFPDEGSFNSCLFWLVSTNLLSCLFHLATQPFIRSFIISPRCAYCLWLAIHQLDHRRQHLVPCRPAAVFPTVSYVVSLRHVHGVLLVIAGTE